MLEKKEVRSVWMRYVREEGLHGREDTIFPLCHEEQQETC